MPPSCGAAGRAALLPPLPPPLSLLLRVRLVDEDPGTRGASPLGGLPKPGIAGAPVVGGPDEGTAPLSIMGADLSFVVAFFNLVPLVMSPSNAPLAYISPLTLLHYPVQLGLSSVRYRSLTRSLLADTGGLLGSIFVLGGGGGGGGPPKPGIGGGGGGGGAGIVVLEYSVKG